MPPGTSSFVRREQTCVLRETGRDRGVPPFKLQSEYSPKGDQPQAIEALVQGLERGDRFQTLKGVTGSGKTFTMAAIIEQVQRPALVIAHNKTLAAQLCSEFREFFPITPWSFVSYYDYFSRRPTFHSATSTSRRTSINDEIDRPRHSATQAILDRRDDHRCLRLVHLWPGLPENYKAIVLKLRCGASYERDWVLAPGRYAVHAQPDDARAR